MLMVRTVQVEHYCKSEPEQSREGDDRNVFHMRRQVHERERASRGAY